MHRLMYQTHIIDALCQFHKPETITFLSGSSAEPSDGQFE